MVKRERPANAGLSRSSNVFGDSPNPGYTPRRSRPDGPQRVQRGEENHVGCGSACLACLRRIPSSSAVAQPRSARRSLLLRVHRRLRLQQGARDLQRHRRGRRPRRARLQGRALLQRLSERRPSRSTSPAPRIWRRLRRRAAAASAAILGQADLLEFRCGQFNGDDAVDAPQRHASSTSSARSASTPAPSGAPA